jgi:predicted ATP-grasp superfamily ATP-dependent carboligase
MRILLSEGGSTSAREAITALALAGHEVEICDPDPRCLGRFSRFVRRYHRCPGLREDPEGYLAFILDQVASGRFDVLIPIHEQGFLLAKVQDRLRGRIAVALPSFASYERAHSKAAFTRMLAELGLPHPPTRFVSSANELRAFDRFPIVVKAAIGTASRGTWMVNTAGELQQAARDLDADSAFEYPVLVQDVVDGPIEHAQAVFSRGRLVACHAFRQIARGAGGGPAIKESISSAPVRQHLARIGEHLQWHGALSVDYIVAVTNGLPHYIDCNPRLVEPMSAYLAGLDLMGLLVDVSRAETPSGVPGSTPGVRTHLAVQALLGCALQGSGRRGLLRECWQLLFKRGPYVRSREELTPVRLDWLSALPPVVTAIWLLASPNAAHQLPKRGWGAHLLSPQSVRKIRSWT